MEWGFVFLVSVGGEMGGVLFLICVFGLRLDVRWVVVVFMLIVALSSLSFLIKKVTKEISMLLRTKQAHAR